MSKQYDERYFRRWYHDRGTRIVTPAQRTRRVAMVVSVAEFVLGRQIRSVLDVGCGEAPWQPILRRLRPRLKYTGIDSSEYAARKFGRTRGVLLGDFVDLDVVAPRREFDLVIASDVFHYLRGADLERGLPALAQRCGGVAYLDFFTSRDVVEGDLHGMRLQPPATWLRLLRRHGLHPLGLQFYAGSAVLENLSAMEGVALLNA